MDRPQTGDVLFTRGKSLFSRLTCRLCGPAGHQATFYDSGFIVEANMDTGRIEKRECNQKFMEMAKAGTEWIIFRLVPAPINPALTAMIQCDLLESCEFERYSKIELGLQLMDVVWNKWILRRSTQGWDACVFRKLGNIWENGVICSKTSNRTLIKNGLIPRDSGLEYGSPSDTYNYLRKLPGVTVLAHSTGWCNFSGD